jgi:hypothetical protein
MKSRTLWDEHFGMLMACGSPGSALAYHLAQTMLEPRMVRRNMIPETLAERGDRAPGASGATKMKAKSDASRATSVRGLLGRLFDRLEAWSWEGRCESPRPTLRTHKISTISKPACTTSMATNFPAAAVRCVDETSNEQLVLARVQVVLKLDG